MARNETYTITVVTTHPSKDDGTPILQTEFNDFDDPYVTMTLSDGTDTVEEIRPLPACFEAAEDIENNPQVYSSERTDDILNVASTLQGMLPKLYDDLHNPPVEPEVPSDPPVEPAPAE